MPPAEDELPDLLDVPGTKPALWKRLLFLSIGVVCVVLGIVGWIVPVMTGIPFYIVALVYFARASERMRLGINRLERKLPRKLRVSLRRWQERLGKKRETRRPTSLPSA